MTGESLTEAVTEALRARLIREAGHTGDRQQVIAEIRRIQARVPALPVLDERTPEEIIGYDDDGCRADDGGRSSAVIAILFTEPTAERLEAILNSPRSGLSAASLVEAGIVAVSRRRESTEGERSLPLSRLRVEIVPVTLSQAEEAIAAFRRFGRGRHPAHLDLTTAFSYALARALGEPLLFVGDDFSQTDLDIAPYRARNQSSFNLFQQASMAGENNDRPRSDPGWSF